MAFTGAMHLFHAALPRYVRAKKTNRLQVNLHRFFFLCPYASLVTRAGDGNRTHVTSLEGWCSTIEPHLRVTLHILYMFNAFVKKVWPFSFNTPFFLVNKDDSLYNGIRVCTRRIRPARVLVYTI